MKAKLQKLIQIGIFNFVLVAFIGTIMRYKIGFEFPYFDQKNLLQAHSHFAFSGWVSHILFTLITVIVNRQNQPSNKLVHWVWANLGCAYGLLLSFIVTGFSVVSSLFLLLEIGVSVGFAATYLSLEHAADNPAKNWFKAALFFSILSSLGTLVIGYMIMSRNFNPDVYLGSLYFYLHFQYSGWFFFALMGLLFTALQHIPQFQYDKTIFTLFFIACFPAFLLSILWSNLPTYAYVFAVVAVLLQLWALIRLLTLLQKHNNYFKHTWPLAVQWLFGLSLFALIVKLLLQAGSIFPTISKLAFGFRSIVIAYLHLVLLGVVSLFLLGYLLLHRHLINSKRTIYALYLYAFGVFANEFILMIQGVASFGYIIIPHLNAALLAVSALLLISLIGLLFAQKNS